MTPEALVLLHVGLALSAPLASVAFEIAGRPERGRDVTAALLIAAFFASTYAAVTATPSAAWLIAATGGGYASVPAAVYLIGAIVLLGSRSPALGISGSGVTLIAFSAAAAGILASSLDIAIILIAAEMTALAAYALVARGHHPRSHSVAVRYFVQGAVATGLFFLGLAMVYGLAGSSTSLLGVRAAALPAAPLLAGALFMTVSLAFKAGAAPFHSWAPDAYEATAGPSAAFLASCVKLASVAAVATLSAALFDGTAIDASRFPVFAGLSVLSVIVGTVGGLAQRSFARMLGYSGIAQVGYALAAISVGAGSAAVVLMVTYAFAVAAAFLVASAWWQIDPRWRGDIAGLAGIASRAPLLAAALAVSVLSMIGLPPLFGFWGKLLVFGRVIDAGAVPLAVFGLLGSVVSVGYYGRVLKVAYFSEPPAPAPGDVGSSPEPTVAGTTDTSVKATAIAAVALAAIIAAGGITPIAAGLSWLQRFFFIA